MSTIFAAALLLALCARPVSAAEGPLLPPVADEAHGLTGADRQAALLVQRSHHQNVLDAYGPLRLSGVDWKDPARPASCEVTLALPTTGYREGSFIEGLPVRRAQPGVFNQLQQQLVEGVSRCGSDQGMAFTAQTWVELKQSALDLMLKNSGTTFCLKDEDCYGVEITDPCDGGRRMRAYGSNTTDAVFFLAYRKFMPVLLSLSAQMVKGAMGQLGDKHPDHGARWGPGRCPMKFWEERPLAASCVQRSCRAKAPLN